MFVATKNQPYVTLDYLKNMGVVKAGDSTDRKDPQSHYVFASGLRTYVRNRTWGSGMSFQPAMRICLARGGCDMTFAIQTGLPRIIFAQAGHNSDTVKQRYCESWVAVCTSTTWRSPDKFYSGCRVYYTEGLTGQKSKVEKGEMTFVFRSHKAMEIDPNINKAYCINKICQKDQIDLFKWIQNQMLFDPTSLKRKKQESIWMTAANKGIFRSQYLKRAYDMLKSKGTVDHGVEKICMIGLFPKLVKNNNPASQLAKMHSFYQLVNSAA